MKYFFAILLLSTAQAAWPAPPDLTGIWTMQADGRAGAALNGPGDFEKTAPFTPLARSKLAEYHELVDATGDTPGAHCVPHGMPLAVLLGGGYPVEFIQRPEQLTIVYETHNEVRRVFLDGRRIDPADILPSRGGVSYGHWEGDTLVVETTGMKESIDQATAHSENARIVERYTPNVRDGMRRLRRGSDHPRSGLLHDATHDPARVHAAAAGPHAGLRLHRTRLGRTPREAARAETARQVTQHQLPAAGSWLVRTVTVCSARSAAAPSKVPDTGITPRG